MKDDVLLRVLIIERDRETKRGSCSNTIVETYYS